MTSPPSPAVRRRSPLAAISSPGLAVLAWVLACGPSGCGYTLVGQDLHVAGAVHSVSVGAIENRSREFGLDKTLAFAFEREFYRRGLLRVEEAPGAGEAVLTGTIKRFSMRPVAFDQKDEALQYEAELVVDLTLRRQADGVVIWQASGLREVEVYSVASRIVVPTSSQFQRGTINPEDLGRFTDIQLAVTEKRLAVDRMIKSIAHTVHDRIIEDF